MILMTEASTITSMIASLGFPIVACGALFWYIVKVQKETNEIVKQNTEVIQKLHGLIKGLCDRIDEDSKLSS